MTVHNTADKLSIDVRHLGLSLYFSIEGVQWVSVEESRINAVQPFIFLVCQWLRNARLCGLKNTNP